MEETVNLQFSLEPDNFKLLENDGYCSTVSYTHLTLPTTSRV